MMNPSCMLARLRAFWKTSRRIDDRARSVPMELNETTWEQEAVDAELSDLRRVPWARPRSGVANQVLRTIHSHRSAPRKAPGIGRVRTAAGLVALLLCAVAGYPLMQAGSTLVTIEVAVAEPELPEGMDLMAGLAMAATPIVNGRLDEPLYREASALRDDTARAASAFLERLTIESIGSDPAP